MSRSGRGRKGSTRGQFLDLKTIGKALTDENHSLHSLGTAFHAKVRKGELDSHGTVSPAALDYNRRDVQATVSVLESMRAEFDRHPIPIPVTDIHSPASFPKAYFREMGITPPLSRMSGISPSELGASLAAFHGGRVMCGVRHVVLPVVATDVSSMYPMMYELCGLQEYLTAKKLRSRPCTAEAKAVLALVTRAWLLDPVNWRRLAFLGLVLPEGDHFSVRAKYAGRHHGFSTGLNPFTSAVPHWYTGFDIAVSILRTGRLPRLLKAFRIVGEGTLDGLRDVWFRGRVRLNPRESGLFARLVAERQRVRRDESIPPEEREWLAAGLKVVANSASFGLPAEFNPQALPKGRRVRVRVEGIGAPFTAETSRPEEAGEFCFPPIAARVTGAGRLLLAVIEDKVHELGGSILAMDTDSAHIVATEAGGLVACPGGLHAGPDGEPAVRALSWNQVDGIARALEPLKPTSSDLRDPFLKIEKVNLHPRTGRRIQLHGLAIAAKRYALFEKLPGGRIRIRKRSEHGLAMYRPPIPKKRREPGELYPADHGWITEVWRRIIRKALSWRVGRPPKWFRQPALQQLAITRPDYLEALERTWTLAGHTPRSGRISPFCFMLAGQLAADAPIPPGLNPQAYRLVAPYSSKPEQWGELPWVDLYSGTSIAVSTYPSDSGGMARLKTIGEVVREYRLHPESKSLGPDGRVCRGTTRGLLAPRPVVAGSIHALGKESHKLQSAEDGMETAWDEVQQVFQPTGRKAWRALVDPFLDALRTESDVKVFAERAGVSARTVWRMKRGWNGSARIQRAVHELVATLLDAGASPRSGAPRQLPSAGQTHNAKR